MLLIIDGWHEMKFPYQLYIACSLMLTIITFAVTITLARAKTNLLGSRETKEQGSSIEKTTLIEEI